MLKDSSSYLELCNAKVRDKILNHAEQRHSKENPEFIIL
jgi:hypothetical protein